MIKKEHTFKFIARCQHDSDAKNGKLNYRLIVLIDGDLKNYQENTCRRNTQTFQMNDTRLLNSFIWETQGQFNIISFYSYEITL